MAYDPTITLDGRAGLARAMQVTRYQTRACLEFVSVMLGSHSLASDNSGYYTTAARAREATPSNRRHYDMDPPAGSVCYFTDGNRDGHVALSAGNRTVRSTDKPSSGQVGTVTLDDIIHSWGGRPWAFWTDWFMGHTIVNIGTTTAGETGTRIQEEDEMTPDQANKLEAVYQALWNGGTNTVDGQVQKYNYGVLPIIVNNQNLIARVITEQAALSAAVNAISTGNVDAAAVTAAARAGAEAALADLHIPTSGTITLN